MNKGVQAVLGVILFVILVFPTLGSIVAHSEANAFNTAKVEILQRMKETGHNSQSVEDYKQAVNEKFDGSFKADVSLKADNDGDGQITYGDVISVELSAEGSGAFNFKKSNKRVQEEGRAEGDNLPKFKTVEELIVDRRAD